MDFSSVPSVHLPRSSFDRTHSYKTTFNSGYLVPVFVDEVLPGDTLKLEMVAFARLNTPLKPFMDNLYLNSFFFFVPNRLVWDHWRAFQGENDAGVLSNSYLVPQLTASTGLVNGSMGDYFGLPVGISSLTVNALPFLSLSFPLFFPFFLPLLPSPCAVAVSSVARNTTHFVQYPHGDVGHRDACTFATSGVRIKRGNSSLALHSNEAHLLRVKLPSRAMSVAVPV